jgi:Ca2+-binding RTX toxin-like protein
MPLFLNGTNANDTIIRVHTGASTGFYNTGTGFFSYSDQNIFMLNGFGGNDNLFGSLGTDTLTGGTGVDFVSGGLGNDILIVNQGDVSFGDFFDGGGDTDTLRLNGLEFDFANCILVSIERIEFQTSFNTTEVILGASQFGSGISLSATIVGSSDLTSEDRLVTFMGETTKFNLSGLTMLDFSQPSDIVFVYGDDDAETIIGTSIRDIISGEGGNDSLNGGLGVDELEGGDGSDTYFANVFNDVVKEINADLVTGGNDIVNFTGTSGTFVLTANVERLTLGGISAINGTGNNLANVIIGNGAANILDGGADALTDTLRGGGGNDTYIINSATDNIVELAGGGTADRAKVSLSFALAAGDNVEFLETTNAGLTSFINLTGNEFGQTITGNAGANVLKGLGGKDVLDGLAGIDSADFSDKTLAVVATLNSAVATNVTVGGVIEDSLKNIENLVGGTALDRLTGDGLDNVLNGGTDALADILTGGLGNDTYIINSATDNIVELAGGGTLDQALASVSFALAAGDNIEFLQTNNITGVGLINLTGNEIAQTIIGNAGANILNGGIDALSDTLAGFGGNDTYIINSVNDNIVELFGGGTADLAKANVSFTLAADDDIEVLETTNAAGVGLINLTGNEIAQTITGNAGANILNGGIDALTDTLIGGLGNDTYVINSLNDNITELVGGGTADRALCSVSFALATADDIEFLQTTNAALTTAINLFGNELAQTIIGNAGGNLLSGEGGNDTLTGGLGNDVFLLNTALNAATNRDTITDFNVAADTIFLEDGVFALIGAPGLALAANLFKNLTTGLPLDADDRILYDDVTGAISYDIDGNGATAAIQFATLTGAPTIDFSDFLVI